VKRGMTIRPARFRRLVLLGGALLLTVLMGGCPIDGAALTTDVLQASLQSITNSLVDTLSTYLAHN